MEQLTGQTGGAVYIPRSTAELETAFQNIAADLAQQYVLSYYPGTERRDGTFHVIDLRVKARKDVRVRARRGYYSPKSSRLATYWSKQRSRSGAAIVHPVRPVRVKQVFRQSL
jgi:hypothetical protein